MLVLSRRLGEAIRVTVNGQPIIVTVVDIFGGRVKLGIDAPDHVEINRAEVADQMNRAEMIAETLDRR